MIPADGETGSQIMGYKGWQGKSRVGFPASPGLLCIAKNSAGKTKPTKKKNPKGWVRGQSGFKPTSTKGTPKAVSTPSPWKLSLSTPSQLERDVLVGKWALQLQIICQALDRATSYLTEVLFRLLKIGTAHQALLPFLKSPCGDLDLSSALSW